MKILIVEDETKLAEALSRGLTHKGYSVDIIADGKKALTRIALYKTEYDLIVLDLMLPGLDGYEVFKGARELEVTIPILILTARNQLDSKVKLLLSGADDYLVKPFSFEELCARIQALLRRPAETMPTTLSLGNLTLNPGDRTVLYHGKPVSLTLKEFSLLEYLMRHPNQVVSREDLLSHLWDFNYESFSNVVDVHVKNIRRKLNHRDSADLVETVRGIGYRIRT